MKRSLKRVFAAALVAGGLWSSSADAQLAKSDFFTSGDGLLVTDTSTGLQWLSPYATRGVSINSVNAGYDALATTYGFSFATSSQVLSMINGYFNAPPIGNPGTAAGYADAANFFNIFGINEQDVCSSPTGGVACPRSQGFAVDGTAVTQIGMIQFGSTGWLIDQPVGTLATYGDYGGPNGLQFGLWLVRPAAAELSTPLSAPLPEPSTWAMMLLGFGAIGAAMRRHSRQQLQRRTA